MGRGTAIEWTDATWNPIRGCSRVSEGCRNCYAESVAARFSGDGQPYEGLASFVTIGKGTEQERVVSQWSGDIRFVERHLHDPQQWKQPLRIFVNSMSDLFHPGVTGPMLAEIFEVMGKARQHTYQILTKRPERMYEALKAASTPEVARAFELTTGQKWPPSNWIFGVSIEDQETANHRLPILARCNAAKRMISYEPAIGPVDFEKALGDARRAILFDWIIVGGESGHRARPMHPDWARSVRDLCSHLGIPFFFKQWGEHSPVPRKDASWLAVHANGEIVSPIRENEFAKMYRVGKHDAGSELDGVEWKEFPEC